MIYGINAGFGEPIAHELPSLYNFRYRSVRNDVQMLTNKTQFEALRFEFVGSGITPLWIMRPEQLAWATYGDTVELLNEPNFYLSPRDYAARWNAIAESALQRGITVYVGSISNLTRDVLKWWEDAWLGMCIKPMHVSIHRYPNDGGVAQPHTGYRSRAEEVDHLRQIIGERPFAVTEFGYHTARRWRWKVWPTRWTEQETAAFATQDWEFWRRAGATHAYIYQLNDGPGSTHLDKYGMRRLDLSWKPIARSHWAHSEPATH